MGKLIIVSDQAIKNNGKFPSDVALKKRIGHDIQQLLPECEVVGKSFSLCDSFASRPSDPIHKEIELVLTQFAIGARYYNLSSLSGASSKFQDPISLWWKKVADPICLRHYNARQRERDATRSRVIEQDFGSSSLVVHTAEDGSSIDTLSMLGQQQGRTRVVQKYGRMYTLQIVRWLAVVLGKVAHEGAYIHRIKPLVGLEEPFGKFLNEDGYLRDRSQWLYP